MSFVITGSCLGICRRLTVRPAFMPDADQRALEVNEEIEITLTNGSLIILRLSHDQTSDTYRRASEGAR